MSLEHLSDYWKKKYPRSYIHLWGSPGNAQYHATFMGHTNSMNLTESNLGDLITKGENFLRKENNA